MWILRPLLSATAGNPVLCVYMTVTGRWWTRYQPEINIKEPVEMRGKIRPSISMMYDLTSAGTQYIFPEWIDLLSLLMTFYSRPFPLLSELPGAIHNVARSYLINHCARPIFALSWQLGSMLGSVFAKSRLTRSTSVSIEHMKRINGDNALHYVWDSPVTERINIKETLITAVSLNAPRWHFYTVALKMEVLKNRGKMLHSAQLIWSHEHVLCCNDTV